MKHGSFRTKMIRSESRFSYAKRHNDTGGGGGEAIINDFLKFRKIIEFQSS